MGEFFEEEIPEEIAKEMKKEAFAKIKPGTLFHLGEVDGNRFFLAIKQVSDLEWEVLEFTEDNRKTLVSRVAYMPSVIHFDYMDALNIDL